MKEAIDIATQEINWHESHNVDGPGDEYKRGFINGLYHLRNLFHATKNAPQQAVGAEVWGCVCGKKHLSAYPGMVCECGRIHSAQL